MYTLCIAAAGAPKSNLKIEEGRVIPGVKLSGLNAKKMRILLFLEILILSKRKFVSEILATYFPPFLLLVILIVATIFFELFFIETVEEPSPKCRVPVSVEMIRRYDY